jgi:phage terminase large subunit-like protein
MDTAERGQCNDEARVKMHRHTKSASSFLPSTKVSIDQYRYEQPLNFSRKISMDVSGRPVNEPIAVETAPKSSGHDRMQKLRKVVSGWMLNKGKEKKPTRIDKPKTSRNSSAVLQNKAAHAPVVKY